ncbi:MAG: peptidoglycan DD-metalloendopeptidase family protein [Pseudomonadota bacterium]
MAAALAFATPGHTGAELARDASDLLLTAADQLAEADRARDRIAALTSTIRAYETGLSAMREGLRETELRERVLVEKLAEEDRDIASLLVLMQNASHQAQNRILLHPGSARETIRAGNLAAMLSPALHERADELEADLSELADLDQVQRAGYQLLEESLSGVREARLALADALSARSDLPPRLATDEAAMQALLNSAETLSIFADSLSSTESSATDGPGRPWSLPVKGELTVGFNERDGRGRQRPGWVISAEAEALVTAPSDATVRFSGEIPDQGVVTVLEADGGALLILTGLDESLVRRDQIIAKNEPIGFLGRPHGRSQENLNDNQGAVSLSMTKELYMEIRQGRAPVDPADLVTLVQE